MPEPNQPLVDTAMWLQRSLQTRALAVRTQVRAAKLLLHRLADIFTALAELASKSERTRRQSIDDPVLEIGARENVGPNDQIFHNAEHWLEIAEQARQVAATVSYPEAKRLVEAVAENYQQLAEVARREGTTKSP